MANEPLISLIREALEVGVDPADLEKLTRQYSGFGLDEIDRINPGEHNAMYLRTTVQDAMREVQKHPRPPKV